jgi:hypothetical protein
MMQKPEDKDIVARVERLAGVIENDEELFAESLGIVMDALELPYHEEADDFTDEEDDQIQTLFARVLHRMALIEKSSSSELTSDQIRKKFTKLVEEELPNM